jgi:hypothetical protein
LEQTVDIFIGNFPEGRIVIKLRATYLGNHRQQLMRNLPASELYKTQA